MSKPVLLCLAGLLGITCLAPCGLRAQTAPASPPDQPGPHPFAAKFQPFVDNHTLAGVVFLVATKDTILDEEAIGYADLDTSTPMSFDNEFWIASMTKPMTATGLMMLVDEGKVKIDDPVEKYLPEFKGLMVGSSQDEPQVPANHPILVREILSHTSGMANIPQRPPSGTLAEWVQTYSKTPLTTQPGTHFLYANAGINTAGRIIEVVSGIPYEQFMLERIFTPLGMSDTTFRPDEGQLARLASAYLEAPDKSRLLKGISPLLPAPGKPWMPPMPAGGLFSTAADLLKFCRMMLQGGVYDGKRYLSESSLAAMTKAYTTPATGGSYGLGWMIAPNGFFHDGAFKTRMAIIPREGLVEIFLVQQEAPIPEIVKQSMKMFSETAEAAFGKAKAPAQVLPSK
jgi:CubicO group peptidase (beta-lactamase class C family)